MNVIQMEITPSLAGMMMAGPEQKYIVPLIDSGISRNYDSASRFNRSLPAPLSATPRESAAWGCSAVRGAFLAPVMWEV